MGGREAEILAVVNYYLRLAEKTAGKPLSLTYAQRAQILCEKFNVKKPYYLKREICPRCGHVLVPSVTARVRLNRHRVVTTCLLCGYSISRSYPRRRSRES
ncbi:MAG: ribonuclease P protein component 4 [Thermoprotei archaeon]